MKILPALILALVSTTLFAAFPKDDTIIYEAATVMTINDPSKPYILVYPCPSCTPLKMDITNETVIQINGNVANIITLMQQARWQADVFADGHRPNLATLIKTF